MIIENAFTFKQARNWEKRIANSGGRTDWTDGIDGIDRIDGIDGTTETDRTDGIDGMQLWMYVGREVGW